MFYSLLEYNECSELDLLKFIPMGQKIIRVKSGVEYRHKLGNDIWKLAVKCKGLGDGHTVLVPTKEGKFDWQTNDSPNEKAAL